MRYNSSYWSCSGIGHSRFLAVAMVKEKPLLLAGNNFSREFNCLQYTQRLLSWRLKILKGRISALRSLSFRVLRRCTVLVDRPGAYLEHAIANASRMDPKSLSTTLNLLARSETSLLSIDTATTDAAPLWQKVYNTQVCCDAHQFRKQHAKRSEITRNQTQGMQES